MRLMIKRILAGLLLVATLIGSMNSMTIEVLAAAFDSSETEETVTLKNSYVELVVNTDNAGYTLKTREGDILTKTDNNKQLLYRGGEGDSSFATIRINGKSYVYGNTKNGGKFLEKPHLEADTIVSTWTQENVCVTQTLQLLTDSEDDKLGTIKIAYEVWNMNDASEGEAGAVTVGTRIVLDTMLGAQDYAVYEMASNDTNGTYTQYTREHRFEQEDIATYFRSLDNNYQPRIVAYGYPDDSTTKPDTMIVGHWFNMASNLWDFEVAGSSFVDTNDIEYKTADSAVALFWNEETLAADAKRTYSYYYGIQSNSDVGENDTIKLTVSLDKDYLELNEDKTGYVDDTVNLQITVANTLPNSKTRAHMAVKLGVDTEYMTILSAKDANGEQVDNGKDVIHITNFKRGQTKVINWTVKVKNAPQTIRYLKCLVKAYVFTDTEETAGGNTLLESNVVDSVKKNVLVPGLSGEKPTVEILTGMPEQVYYKGNRNFIIRGEGFDIFSDTDEWQLMMTDMQTGEESFIDSSNIQFNSDYSSIIVNFKEYMAEGEYKLTILPGENLKAEQVGLPESITSENMKFFMSSDEDLVNPPVGGVGIRKEMVGDTPTYVIDTFASASEVKNSNDYLLTFTGNLYQSADSDEESTEFVPIQGDGSQQNIIINRIVNFGGEEMIIDYLYEDGQKVGVQVKMEGNTGVIGGSSKVWTEETVLQLENGKNYSLDPDEVESGDAQAVCMKMQGILGAIQKISGFVLDLRYGVFYKRGSNQTISFGGSLSLGFMSVDQYDGVEGEDLFAANIEDVRYGERRGRAAGLIGVKADVGVAVPQFTAAMPSDMWGSLKIDTIDHPYLVNVAGEGKFATFKAAFELEIIGSEKHGVPVPNILSLTVGGVKPGAPIILPVAPVVYLQGASGKVEGLYSLFFPGETDGWPDTTVTIAGQLSAVDIFSGWIGLSMGTRSASLYGEDMKIAGMEFLDSVSGKFVWYPEVSFSFDANMEVLKVIKGEVHCYLLMAGDNAPDVDMNGKVQLVVPAILFGQDLVVAGVGIGGNKTKLYGEATIMGMNLAYEYMWGDGSTDVDFSVFSARAAGSSYNEVIGFKNVNYVAQSQGELSETADVTVSRTFAARAGNPTASINENGGLVVTGLNQTDTMIRAYYDTQDDTELTTADVDVIIGGSAYNLVEISVNEEGIAENMESANFTAGSDEVGTYVLISVPADKISDEVVISSEKASFSYGQVMSVNPVAALDTISAEYESDSLSVTTTMSNTDNATGTKSVYLSETTEGDRAYGIMVATEEGVSYGLDADTSALDIPYYVPSGEYYVTTVIDGTQDGVAFHSEITTTEAIEIINADAPTEAISAVRAEASGDGNARITLEGYDASLMDGVYVEADRTNADGTVTEAYQAMFIENSSITVNEDGTGEFELALSPEETGNDYVFKVFPMNNTAGETEEPKYALGLETISQTVNIPYPAGAEVTVSYDTDYVEEEAVLGSGEGEEAATYTNKVFTEVPEEGIRIAVTTDKPVTGTITLNDEVVSKIIGLGTEFPSYYAKLTDGEYTLCIQTQTEDGDTTVVDESIKVDTTEPILQVFTPETGSVAADNQITFSGQIESGADLSVTINEVPVALPEDVADFFETTITIPEEVRQDMVYEWKATARDAYGRTSETTVLLLNPDAGEIESVYLTLNGERIETDTVSVKGMTEGKLALCGVTSEGNIVQIPSTSVIYDCVEEENTTGITVDASGNVEITGETTLAVSAQYFVTEDYCYQANVVLDSYQEEMKTVDAREPVLFEDLPEEMITVTAGEELTLSVDAASVDGGKLTYTWYQKQGEGEYRPLGEDSNTYTTTLEEKGGIYYYYVNILNTTRTTGVDEAMIYSREVMVYVRDGVEKDDLQVTGDNVTRDEITYYNGDITVKAKEEGTEIALVTEGGNLEWQNELILSGEETGNISYPIMLRRNGTYESEVYYLQITKDHMGPEGSITLGETIWQKLLGILTFGLFFEDSQTLTIAAEDAGCGMQENGIAYYKSASRMTAEQLKALEDTAWTVGTSVSMGAEESESGVVYARMTDALGNVSYISSDGIVVGDAAPVVEFTPDDQTQLEENAHRYLEQAVITAVVKDDTGSNGITAVSYRLNDGQKQTVAITENQTRIEIPVTVTKTGVNTIYVTAADKSGNTATTCEVIEIYSQPEFQVTAAEEIIYDGSPIEAGTDIMVSAGESKGEITYSYRPVDTEEYQEGLPVYAGAYEVKASVALDEENFYAAAETTVELEILKATQNLQFSSDAYKPVIGKRFKVVVGGVTSTGEVEITAADTSIVRIVTAEQKYDADKHIVSVPAETLAAGTTVITVRVAGDENHEAAELTTNVIATAEVTAEHPYTINGMNGSNGWYQSDVTITAADGYTMSATADGEYQTSYAVVGEGADRAPKTMYFRNLKDNLQEITLETINIDMTAPTGSIAAGTSKWRQFLNTITFGYFFKDTVVVKVADAADAVSGVDSVVYYQSTKAMSMEQIQELNDNDWTTSAVTLTPDAAAIVYAKITDVAGNVTYLSTDGIIVDKTQALLTVTPNYDTSKWITKAGASILVTVSDALSGIADGGITYQIDGGTVYTGSKQFTISGLDDGVHNIVITAVDKAGNVSRQTVSWKQDIKAPTLTLEKTASNQIGITAAAGVSGIASVMITGDGKNWTDITASYTKGYTVSEPGTYEVRLTTNAGITVSKTIDIPEYRQSQKITVKKSSYKLVYGAKAFSLGAKSNRNTKLTYKSSNTKVVKVTAKGKVKIVGTGTAKIVISAPKTDKYKAAEKTISITVKPKKTTLKKVTSTKKKTITVKWKKDAKASGYEIFYAANKKFKKAKKVTVNKYKTTSTTIKKLSSNKTYYIRMRSFKKVGSKKIYGAYSKTLKVKVK